MRQAREWNTTSQPHAYLAFPLFHPGLISQYRILPAWWLVVYQCSRVDRGPAPPRVHGSPISTRHRDACVLVVNLIVIVTLASLNGAKVRWRACRVLVPLTSLKCERECWCEVPWGHAPLMCEKQKLLFNTDHISLGFSEQSQTFWVNVEHTHTPTTLDSLHNI